MEGERDCIIEGCKSRVDGMPSWLRKGWAMKFEKGIESSANTPTLLRTSPDMDTCRRKCEEHEEEFYIYIHTFDFLDFIYLIYSES